MLATHEFEHLVMDTCPAFAYNLTTVGTVTFLLRLTFLGYPIMAD